MLRDRLAAREAGRQDFDLIDVREPAEYALGRIPGSRLVPQGRILSGEALGELSRNRDIILYCQAGTRSQDTLAELRDQGYARTTHLQGGLLGWVAGAGEENGDDLAAAPSEFAR
jgi:adenylyltransferase/sulfurtransferase